MKAKFKYLKSNLIYPEVEEIADTYILTITRKTTEDRLQVLGEFLSDGFKVIEE